MALYQAYGVLTKAGATRSPFLLDVTGATQVAMTDGDPSPGVAVTMSIFAPTDAGASGLGLNLWLTPLGGHDLSNLRLTTVINMAGSTMGTDLAGGDTSFIVVELVTGPEKVPALIAQVGQIKDASHPHDTDTWHDDVYVVEAVAAGPAFPLHLVGGTVSGAMITFPGKLIRTTGAYGEDATTIRGIDLARVRPGPTTATSPSTATWFDVTARPTVAGVMTHLKVFVDVPHLGPDPDVAPVAQVGTASTTLPAGRYRYSVVYVYENGNESRPGPASGEVTLPVPGVVTLSNVAAPTAAPDLGLGVLMRRIYRQGPGDGDLLLIGQLSGPKDPKAPNPLATTFVDDGVRTIPTGATTSIAPGFFRYPDRMRVRYSADTPLDITGTVVLVDPGVGAAGVARYDGTITGAPTSVTVVQDDGAALDDELQPATVERSRVQWTGSTRTPQLTVRLPAIEVDPYGPGVSVRIDDVPTQLGFDWAQRSELLSSFDVRGQLEMNDLDHLVGIPGVDLGPATIGRLVLNLGDGRPAAVWPEGDATVGVELQDLDRVPIRFTRDGIVAGKAPYGAVTVRGVRWVRLRTGTGFPGVDETSRMRVDLLLGADPSRPPGGDRTMRFLRVVDRSRRPDDDVSTAPNPDDNLRWWGRAGVLPDRLAFTSGTVHTGAAQTGTASTIELEGAVRRIVGNVFDAQAMVRPDVAGQHLWLSTDGTGAPKDVDGADGPGRYSLKIYADKEQQSVDSSAPLQVSAALRSGDLAGRPGAVHGRIRMPVHLDSKLLQLHNVPPMDDGLTFELQAQPDGMAARVAAVWNGAPVAARSGPQLRMRRRPAEPDSGQQLDGVTVRVGPLTSITATVQPAVVTPGPVYIDPVARVAGGIVFADRRPNRSFRVEQIEDDPRVPGGARLTIKARVGELPDLVSGDVRKDESNEGVPFFLKADTSSPVRDGEVWGLPTQLRAKDDPRGELAGIGNISVLLDELPTALEYVDLANVPAPLALPEYAGGESVPRVHPPGAANVKPGGFRLHFTGRAAAHGIRFVSFKNDEVLDLEDQGALKGSRQQSKWHETLVPILDLRPDPAGGGGPQTLWVWDYSIGTGDDETDGKGFRISDGALASLAMRDYEVLDDPDRTWVWWDQITPATYTTTVYLSPILGGMAEPETKTVEYGTWAFVTDVQMKDYRGEITVIDSPNLFEKLGNPYGDWEAGPGQWYLRARDKLKIITYTGDLYFGNTGNGYHVPATNGIFSTLEAPYLLTWPT